MHERVHQRLAIGAPGDGADFPALQTHHGVLRHEDRIEERGGLVERDEQRRRGFEALARRLSLGTGDDDVDLHPSRLERREQQRSGVVELPGRPRRRG